MHVSADTHAQKIGEGGEGNGVPHTSSSFPFLINTAVKIYTMCEISYQSFIQR